MNYFNNYTPEDFINDGYKKIGNRYYKVEGNTLAVGRDDDWVSKYDPALKTEYYTMKEGGLEYSAPGHSGMLYAGADLEALLDVFANLLKDVE